ncbi:MAG: glycerate kinase [Coriobacteriales bacterium]|nr:glycerate kinase [Coriobacteriales bacterium]
MPHFLFASDSFKGTISSARAAELLASAALEAFPEAVCHGIEVADGGEGTVEAVVAATGGTLRTVEVTGPRGARVQATYGLLGDGRAIIEMAAASGLPLLRANECDPRYTSTWGTGELIVDALDQGVRDITLAIGGSATNDGGMGCMCALGARFLDGQGSELTGTGGELAQVASIDLSCMDSRVYDATFCVMCDVDNPLLGERGATRVFGPQKGATPALVEELERGMRSYANVLEKTFDGLDVMSAGMGAAGGLGAASRAFLRAKMLPGIEQVLNLVGFDALVAECDLCVTGEGHADAQSAHGKVVSGVAARCKRAGVPCVALVGGMNADACELFGCGVDALVPTVIDVCLLEEALDHAERNYTLAAQRIFTLLRLGARLR